jgi:hypothetical protein
LLVVRRSGYVSAASVLGVGSALNEGGMCLLAGVKMPLGTKVAVEFNPPSTHNYVRLPAAVRNRQPLWPGVPGRYRQPAGEVGTLPA